MALLGFPRVPYVEFYLAGDWHNLVDDVRQDPGIVIERGRKNEAAKPTPSRCTFTLDNGPGHGDGDYSPRNPTGTWFPDFRRNVPVRVGLEVGSDDFDRTVTDGWGTGDLGDWINGTSSGGTVADTDWTVSSGTARHSVPAENAYRLSALDPTNLTWIDSEIRFTVTVPTTNVTGAVIATLVPLRALDDDNYVYVQIVFNTSDALSIGIKELTDGVDATLLADTTVIPAIVGFLNEMKVAILAEGSTIRAKAWHANSVEPLDWQVSAVGASVRAGYTGIYSVVSAGNTNTKPLVFQYDDYSIRLPRFTGETAGLAPGLSLSQSDKMVEVECGTLFRRLEQGNAPVKSPMRRSLPDDIDDLIGYWPCEDGRFSTSLAPGLEHDPMRVLWGASNVKFSEDDTFPGSNPLPVIGTTEWRVVVPPHTATGTYEWRSLLKIGGGQDDTAVFLYELTTTGTAWRWHVQLEQDGSLSVRAFGAGIGVDALLLDDTGNAVITDIPMYLELTLLEDGSGNVFYSLNYLELGQSGPGATLITSGFVLDQTLGKAMRFGVIAGAPEFGFPGPKDTVVGHLSLATSDSALSTALDFFKGRPGETVTERTDRLVTESGIPAFGESDDNTASFPMGPQTSDTLVNLFIDGANTDQGYLYEARGANGFAYKAVEQLYGPVSLVTLDHDLGHLAPDFVPTDDDQTVRNDVTAKARRGSRQRR